jgi:hypothetical protein
MFGMAAQTALHHFGLDLASMHNDLIVDRVAQSRSAMAWWAWWIVGVSAFFVGPFSVSLARYLAANWWLFRGLRLLLSAAIVLGLAAVGHLTAAPLRLDITAGAAIGALVATLSALLSLLGARAAATARPRTGRTSMIEHWRRRACTPVPSPLPLRGGGSVNSGFPMRRSSTGHSLVPQPGRLLRVAIAGMLAIVALAAVSAVSGLTVLLEVVAPPAARGLMAWKASPATVALNQARASAMALASRPAIETVGERRNSAVPLSASELTFAKGYAKRQAVLAEATKFGPKAKIRTATRLKVHRVAALHVARRSSASRNEERDRRAGARYAYNRDAYDHQSPDHHGYDRRDERHSGVRSSRAASHRHTGHSRHRQHERYRGYDHYARADHGYRVR